MEINNALQNLKKNQLLSTIEFKKLQKTENIITTKNRKSPIVKHQRYEYKPNPGKYSALNLMVNNKKSEVSKNISDVSSTLINEGK